MEKKNENPKLYLITGDRCSGKTSILEALIANKDTAIAYDHSDSMQKVSDCRAFDTDHPEFWKKLESAFNKDLLDYIKKQSAHKENIYIETSMHSRDELSELQQFAQNTIREFHPAIKDIEYDTTIIYCLCNSIEQSKERYLSEYPKFKDKPLELTSLEKTSKYAQADMYTRYRGFKCDQQIYSLVDGKPKLMANMESGKVTQVNPQMLTTNWFKEGNKGFRAQIAIVLKNQSQQKRLQQHQKQNTTLEKPKNPTRDQKARNRRMKI